MFENLRDVERVVIYKGLKALIDSNDNSEFHNADRGHPVYVLGSKGKVDSQLKSADSPETNLLFKMITELTEHLRGTNATSYKWWYDFGDWEKFCKYIVSTYEKRK